jgi:iron complex outermembrane recepter protein
MRLKTSMRGCQRKTDRSETECDAFGDGVKTIHLGVALAPTLGQYSTKARVNTRSIKGLKMRDGRSGVLRSVARLCPAVVLLSTSTVVAQQQSAERGSQEGLTEIVVTAEKKSESLVQVPVSVTALSEKTLTDYNIQEFSDYAGKVPNLNFSVGANAQPGLEQSRSVAIRGMSGTGTTSLYLDETPLPDSLNPAVVDLARIEVLRGPQGTLFGESSLGGNIRLISNRPSLTDDEFKYMGQGGWTEHGTEPDYGGNAVANLVVVPNTLAVRVMAVANHDSGYITRTYPCDADATVRCATDGVGSHDTYGGSVAALWQATERFAVDAKLLTQSSIYPNGFPVVLVQPLAYSLSLDDNRVENQPERSDFHWYMPALTLRYEGDGWNATAASGYFESHQLLKENGVEGLQYFSQSVFGFSPNPATIPLVPADYFVHQFSQEVRLAFEPTHNLSGIVGAFYRKSDNTLVTSATVPGLEAATGLSDLLYNVLLRNLSPPISNKDKSVFGEFYYKMGNLTATLGARTYWLTEQNDTLPLGGFIFTPTSVNVTEHGTSPKYALKYEISPQSMIYTSAAKGFRPGGGNLQPPPECDSELSSLGIPRASTLSYKSDDVWSYEIGGKSTFADGKILLTAALFDVEWKNIQQQINLATCGSVFTANAGAARNRGGELELSASPIRTLSLRAGLGYVDAVITQPGPGSPLYAGEPVFNVPKVTANVGAVYTVLQRADKQWLLTTDASYVGSNYSGNTSASLPIKRPGYAVWNASTALLWGNADELSLYVKNLTNSIAFYGDLQPQSFGPDVTINGVTYPIARVQVSPPLQIGLQYRHGF